MNSIRKAALGAAVIGSTLAGGAVGVAFLGSTANAASGDTSISTAASSTDQSTASSSATAATPAAPTAPVDGTRPAGQPGDPSKGGHVANGITETVLTGDTADKVTAAALAAVPGGTTQRVENDAEGATYEAHMLKADGSQVTVKLGADFSVSSIEDGMK